LFTPRTGILLTQGNAEDISELPNATSLWAVGPGASMPIGIVPEALPAADFHGVQFQWPDVLVPTQVPPDGLQLAVHKVENGQLSNEVVAELTLVPPRENVYSIQWTVTRSQKNCGSACTGPGGGWPCHFCEGSPCGAGASCGMTGGTYYASSNDSASAKCNNVGGACSGGNQHACWTGHWNDLCILP
jgi:hypothetical protein